MHPAFSYLIPTVILLVSVACQLPERARFSRTETRSFELKPGGHLRAQTFDGSIVIEGWERDEVSLVAEIRERREGDVHFVAEAKDGFVLIRAEQESKRKYAINFGKSSGVSYALKVPRKTMITLVSSNGRLSVSQIENEVDAYTTNGRITVDEIVGKTQLTTSNGAIKANAIEGELIVTTSNGSIEAKDVQNGVELETTNGRVEIRNIKGKAIVNTSNGSIIAENIEGDLTARSSNGRVEIQKVRGGVNATTSNASIKAHDLNGMGRGIRLATSNAGIDVMLGQAEGMLEATTSKGDRVRIENPNIQPTVEGVTTKAKIGNGGQTIELKTTNGRITVR